MDECMERQSKSLGFRLFGNVAKASDGNEFTIDTDSTYEIQFFPGESPLGHLAQLGRGQEKRIDVELPSEIRQSNFEQICSYFLEKNQQLVVKETGFEKLKNRKLVLDLGNPTNSQIVNVIIFIQGKFNKTNYEIELNPYDITLSHGEMNSQKCQVLLEDLKHLKEAEIKKVYSKLKPTNFQIKIEKDRIIFHSSPPFKQFIDSLGKPTKYQNINSEPVKKEAVYTILMPEEPDEVKPKVKEKTVPQQPAQWIPPEKLLPAPELVSATPNETVVEEKPKGFFAKLWSYFFK